MFRTIRTHWKKSLFAFCASSYGAKWSYDRYKANQIRQFYCRQASILGSQSLPSMTRANRIAVLLNGKANNGKAKSIFDKTIFPLLHLIGLDVRVYRLDTITDPNGLKELLTTKIEAKELSAVMIIGGDGTLSELTPHFLQSATLENLPICLVPIGEHVSFARRLFPITNQKKLHDDISFLCESVFALFNGKIVRKPLLKITMSNQSDKPIYASALDFGHYSRLEQLQKRLWYFSYLKYPITSVYHYITNSLRSVLSSEQASIVYSRPCSGCLRCQPGLLEHYHLSQQVPQTSFFSRLYRSNRSTGKPTASPVPQPVENPDCGVEYCLDLEKKPIQLWVKLSTDDRSIQVDFSDQLQRFNYQRENYPKQTLNVQHIRFSPNIDLVKKQLLINHEKVDRKNEDAEENLPFECRIELSDRTLKFIEVNQEFLIAKQGTLKPRINEREEDALEKKGIFLFPHRQQRLQVS